MSGLANRVASPAPTEKEGGGAPSHLELEGPWKLMIVDDEEAVHTLTRMVLRDISFDGRGIEFLSGYSGEQAKCLLKQHPDTAVLFLDVVMETDQAGLDLVSYVREELGNQFVRIVIRTGQPGQAPVTKVITRYDINDYWEKTGLSAQQMISLVITSLRTYKHLRLIDLLRDQLHREKGVLAAAQAVARMGNWEWNVATAEISLSTEAFRIFGLDARRFDGTYKTLADLMEPADRAKVGGLVKQCLTGQIASYDFQYRITRPDGDQRVVHEIGKLFRSNSGKPSRVMSTVHDVTLQKRAEQELRVAATTFQTHEGIMITDRNATILRTNKAFSAITGFSEAEVVGQNPRILQSKRHDVTFYDGLWAELNKTGRWQGEIWNRCKNDEALPVWLSITAVTDDQGEVSQYVGAFHDLSEVKRQQSIIERTAVEEQVLSKLLRLSLEPQKSTGAYLQLGLVSLLNSVPWLNLAPQGGIFLVEGNRKDRKLRLVAEYQLPDGVMASCISVPFGTCLCGQAALEGTIQFASDVDDRHEILYEGMQPHGHYSVPILSGRDVLGVMVLYLPAGRIQAEHEKTFLHRVADVFSMGILRKQAEDEIEHMAYHDPLTGLPNRNLFLDRLKRYLPAAERHNMFGAVLCLDLDRFKTLNDSLGHSVGDALLVQVAQRLCEEIRKEDTVARLEGDEFGILLPDLSDQSSKAGYAARTVADKLCKAVSQPYDLQRQSHFMTPSIGIIVVPEQDAGADEVLRHADAAMYRAKADGRNAVRFFLPSMQVAADKRLELEKDLYHALEHHEYVLHFQVQVDVNRQVVGAEALLRWRHPTKGLIAPLQFISVAEETGLIVSIGQWVLEEACTLMRKWEKEIVKAGKTSWCLSINVSPRQFHQRSFVRQVEKVFAETGVDPSRIVFELTESVLIEDVTEAAEKMLALKALGVGFSIDDFGIGYSSLSYLKSLPVDELKIDKSFVQDIATEVSDAAIVDTIIAMASHLGLKVVAEGVETQKHFNLLCQKGCRIFQGYYLSRPLPAEDIGKLLSAEVGLPLKP